MANLPSKMPGPKGFWQILKSVSVSEIALEANRPLTLALVGEPETCEAALRALFVQQEGEMLLPERRDTFFLSVFENMTEEAGFSREKDYFDVIIDLGVGRAGAPEGAPIYSVSELGGWNDTLERILIDRPTLALSLARNLPGFRPKVARDVIANTSGVNAEFALLSGLAEQVPLIGAIGLPGLAFSDMIVITKNQVMMAMRLAACYGLEVDYQSHMKEIAPLLGGAIGWRAIARELIGAVPIIGFLPRAAIAYAGTMTAGRAIQFYYETGREMTGAQVRKLYADTLALAKEKVRALATRKRKRAVKALPAAPAESIEEPQTLEIAQTAAAE